MAIEKKLLRQKSFLFFKEKSSLCTQLCQAHQNPSSTALFSFNLFFDSANKKHLRTLGSFKIRIVSYLNRTHDFLILKQLFLQINNYNPITSIFFGGGQ